MQRSVRESILDIFDVAADAAAFAKLELIPSCDWKALLNWMDASGIALYFFARMMETGADRFLPRDVLDRLRQNQSDNRERTSASITELLRIQNTFAKSGIRFILLKGLSLVPQACPDAALRIQLDIDLMVESRNIHATELALSTLGYYLAAVSGATWEYRTFADRLPHRRDLYKAKPQRSVEIHVPPSSVFKHLHQSAEEHAFEGCAISVLSAAERFIWQAEHIEKHMRHEWSRVSWLLEFRNNIQFYCHSSTFWINVRAAVSSSPSRWEALGVATAFTRTALPNIPEIPMLREAEARLSPRLKLWIGHYGRRVLTSDFPGRKLYLLLPDHPASRRRRLFPLHAPQSVAAPSGRKTQALRMRAVSDFTGYAAQRSAFHLREAIRYAIEFLRWNLLLSRDRKAASISISSASSTHGDSRAEAPL